MNLNEAITLETKEQFQRLMDANIRTRPIFIHVKHDSDGYVMVSYAIGESYENDRCEGSNLYETITEYMRRKGWTEQNKPMKLIGAQTIG